MRAVTWALATTFILIPGVINAQEVNPIMIQARPVRIVSCDQLPNDLNKVLVRGRYWLALEEKEVIFGELEPIDQ